MLRVAGLGVYCHGYPHDLRKAPGESLRLYRVQRLEVTASPSFSCCSVLGEDSRRNVWVFQRHLPRNRHPFATSSRKPGHKSTHRPLSSSFLGLPERVLNINHKKELLRGLWVGQEALNSPALPASTLLSDAAAVAPPAPATARIPRLA